MSPRLQSLGLDRLSLSERVEVMHELWESIETERPYPPPSDELRQELRRRAADIQAHPEQLTSWEAVSAEALARIGER